MSLTPGELARKLVHVGVGGFALLLRYLTWPGAALMALAAFLFNWQVLPRVGGRRLWRGDDHAQGYPRGILIYPLSVLGLVLLFRDELHLVAAIWGLLAFGDGMASLVGQTLGGPRLPWNPSKGWAGFGAFVVCGSLAAAVLMGWTLGLPAPVWLSWWLLSITLPAALVGAIVESLPTTLDDNFTVPLAGALVVPLFAEASLATLLRDPALVRHFLLGLAVNAAIALLAWRARSVDAGGAVAAVVIGTLITVGLGPAGLSLMIAFFVLGSLATRLGYARKAVRGIAQEKGGARGVRHALANGSVPAFLALVAGLVTGELRALLTLAYAAAVATAAADTCSSEVGKAYGRRTFLITTLRPVPPGTEGAVSVEGTLAGLAAAAIVASLGTGLGLYDPSAAMLVALAGLLGSLLESLVGTVAERRGWMGNDLLNAFNTLAGALIAALAAGLWPGLA